MNNIESSMNQLTWKELAEVEKAIGIYMGDWEQPESALKVAVGIQWKLASKNKPELTFDEAMGMSIESLMALSAPGERPKALKS